MSAESKRQLQRVAVFVLGWVASGGIPRAGAQTNKELPIEGSLSIRYFAEYTPIEFSPDGRFLAYTVRSNAKKELVEPGSYQRTGIEWYSVGSDVRIVDTTSKGSTSLTSGEHNNLLPSWSPNGRFLAFLSDRDGSGQTKLWVWDRPTNVLRKVSDAILRCEQIQWTPDSRQILVTALPTDVSPEEYVRTTSPEAVSSDSVNEGQKDQGVTIYQSLPSPQGGNENPTTRSGPWNLDRYLRDLIAIDLAGGRENRIVKGKRISRFFLSPDGSRIVYSTPKRFEHPGSQQILFDLVMTGRGGEPATVLASDVRLDYDGATFSWSQDNTRVSFMTGGPGAPTSSLYLVDVGEATPQPARLLHESPGSPSHQGPPLWDADRNAFFVSRGSLWRVSGSSEHAAALVRIEGWDIRQIIATSPNRIWEDDNRQTAMVIARNRESRAEAFFSVNLASGETREFLRGDHCLACANPYLQSGIIASATRIAFLKEDAAHPSDLWIFTPTTGNCDRLTSLNPQFDEYAMGSTRLIHWIGVDGMQLQGALLLPAGYVSGKRYPLIAFVYAGAAPSRFVNRFGVTERGPLNPQLLASRGYAVLFPDSPQQLETPMLDLLKTVIPGVNKAVEMGIADPARLGVMGFSNGGYSTLALIVQTTQFKAAIEIEGMADLIASYGEMNSAGAAYASALFEHGQDGLGGTPWEVRDRYIENSPIYYLDRISTPLLIIQGDRDLYVAPFLADELFVGMRRLQKEVGYVKYSGEGHDPVTWSYAHQIDLSRQIIRWLGVHLKDEAGH